MNSARVCTIAGSPTKDFTIKATEVTFMDHTVCCKTPGRCFKIPYLGEPIGWGAKRTAAVDLKDFSVWLEARPGHGGGAVNTARQVAGLPPGRRPVEIRLASTTRRCPELVAELNKIGVKYFSFGDDPPATSFVVENPPDNAERLILTDPVSTKPLNLSADCLLAQLPGHDIGLPATNSPKSPELAAAMSQAAAANGSPHYIEITRSLPAAVRLDLMENSCLAAGNAAEFSEVLKLLDIPCPADEEKPPLEEYARAISAAAICTRRDLVLHLGHRGCIGGDSRTGLLFHLGLHHSKREKVKLALRGHPDRVNGRGDRFFGSLFTAHAAFVGDDRARSRLARAAWQASIDVVASFSPHLHPDASWFTLRIFPERFGA